MASRPTSSDPMPLTAVTCRVVFGGAAAAVRPVDGVPALRVALPVLAGPAAETIGEGFEPRADAAGECTMFDGPGGRVAGFAIAPAELELEEAAREVYRRIFAAARGRHLYRIWNYVPQINVIERGLENYRRFCRGRAQAFEAEFGTGFQRQLPAASAVGALHGPLAVTFLAGADEARHFENPRQVPAFEYPAVYGPRPPSFSRATRVVGGGKREIFVSGTAAIVGHATVAADDLAGQLACTRENLALIAAAAGAGAHVGADDGWRRSFKIYVRHGADLPAVHADLARHLLRKGDEASYLQAELCRAELRVEIEAVLTNELV